MKIRKKYTCPLEVAHDMIRGKWKTIIIFELRAEEKSLSTLKRTIVGITEKVLIEQLAELIEFDIVQKKTFPGYPLKVRYFLTDRGKKILDAVYILQTVGNEYLQKSK